MMPPIFRTLLPFGGWLILAGAVSAQSPYGRQGSSNAAISGLTGSPLSPFLNLNSGRGSPAVNYYNFVRPALQQQQQQLFGGGGPAPFSDPYPLASDITLDPTGPLPRPTGLPATFGTYGGYFNSMGTMGVPTFGRGSPQQLNRGNQQFSGRR